MAKQISEAAHSAKNKIKMTPGDRVLNLFFYLFITLFAVICLIPFILVVSSSLTQEQALTANGYRLWPSEFSLDAYRLVMVSADIPQAYIVTIFITIVGTFLSMLFTCAVSYAMSVKNFKSRSVLALFIYFTMLFNGGLVATYLLITKTLMLQNTIWVLLFPSLCNAWNILLMRNFFNGIPDSLAESAKIDGANDIVILFRIIIPISLPGIATIGLFYAVGFWNNYMSGIMYITRPQLKPLQQYLYEVVTEAQTVSEDAVAGYVNMDRMMNASLITESIRAATIMLSSIPIMLVYPFLQKYFVAGLRVGSVKG